MKSPKKTQYARKVGTLFARTKTDDLAHLVGAINPLDSTELKRVENAYNDSLRGAMEI